jgi:hypothetical protein
LYRLSRAVNCVHIALNQIRSFVNIKRRIALDLMCIWVMLAIIYKKEYKRLSIFILSIIITIVILPFKLFNSLFSSQTEFTRKNISSINRILSRMPVNGFHLTSLIQSSSIILFCADCLSLYCFQLIHMNLRGTSFDNKWEILTCQ